MDKTFQLLIIIKLPTLIHSPIANAARAVEKTNTTASFHLVARQRRANSTRRHERHRGSAVIRGRSSPEPSRKRGPCRSDSRALQVRCQLFFHKSLFVSELLTCLHCIVPEWDALERLSLWTTSSSTSRHIPLR